MSINRIGTQHELFNQPEAEMIAEASIEFTAETDELLEEIMTLVIHDQIADLLALREKIRREAEFIRFCNTGKFD